MISKNFFKSSFIYSVIGSLPFVSGIVVIPFYTNLLSASDYGVYALYYSIMFLVQVLVTFNLDSYIGIQYINYQDDPEKLKKFIGTILISLMTLGIIILLPFLVFGSEIFRLVFKNSNLSFLPWGLLIIITAIFNSFLKTYSSLLIYQQRAMRFLWINLSNFIMVIGFTLGFLFLYPYTMNGPIFGRLIPGLVSFTICVLFLGREFGIKFETLFIKDMFSFCFPFLLYTLLFWSISYIDRYIILHYLKETVSVGIYDFAVKCSTAIEFLQGGMIYTIFPKVFNIWKKNNLTESTVEVNRYYNGFTAVSLLFIPMFVLAIPILVPLIITNHIYYQSFKFIAIVCLGYSTRGLLYMFMGPIYYQKKTKSLPKALFFSAIVQILLSILLIKHFGLMGAAWANFISKPFQAFFMYLESRKIFRYKINLTKQIYLPLFYIVLVLMSELLNYSMRSNWINLMILVIMIISVSLVYKKELVQLYNQVKNSTFLKYKT